MGRFEITQRKGLDGEETVLKTGIRRANGAEHELEAQLQFVRDLFRRKALAAERVVEGPTGVEGETAVVLFGPESEQVIVTAIRKR